MYAIEPLIDEIIDAAKDVATRECELGEGYAVDEQLRAAQSRLENAKETLMVTIKPALVAAFGRGENVFAALPHLEP